MIFQNIYPHRQCSDTVFVGRSSACIIHYSLLRNTSHKGRNKSSIFSFGVKRNDILTLLLVILHLFYS